MKIVVDYYDPCLCASKIRTFMAARQQSGYRDLGVDSIVECDCGTQYLMTDTRQWVPLPLPLIEEIKDA